MSEYTQAERETNFRNGYAGVNERGPSWWGRVDGITHFEGPVPQYAIDALIGFDPIQVPMSFVHPLTGTLESYAVDGGPQVVLRSDTYAPIGYNGGGSKLFGYRDWFLKGPAEILDASENELGVGFVGLFKNGAQAAIQLELEKTIVDDKTGVGFRPFLYGATSLDGSLIPQYGKGHTLIVCDNTFRQATAEAKKSGLWYGVRQTVNARRDTLAAREALQIVHGMSDEITRELHAMTEKAVSPAVWSALLDELAPVPEKDPNSKSGGRAYTSAVTKRDELDHLWQFDNRVAPWAGTAFGVSQAFTTWSQHMSIVRGAGRTERNKLNMITGKATSVETQALATLDRILANV